MISSKSIEMESLESRTLFSASATAPLPTTLAGKLDPTYGTNGTAEAILQNQNAKIEAFATEPNTLATFVAAVVPGADATHYSIEVLKFTGSGMLDTTFGVGGISTISRTAVDAGQPIPFDTIKSIAFTPDDKILIGSVHMEDAGISSSEPVTTPALSIIKLNFNGTIDTSFGNNAGPLSRNGILDVDPIEGPGFGTDEFASDVLEGLATNPDGTFYVVGTTNSTDFQLFLAKFLPDGTMVQFGGGSIPHTSYDINSIAVQDDGKVVAAGHVTIKGKTEFLAVRFNPGFTAKTPQPIFDPTFGKGGVVTLSISGIDDEATSLAIQYDGKILLGGYTTKASGKSQATQFALVRLNSNGHVDTSFASRGIAVASFPHQAESAITSVNIDNNGNNDYRIIATGKAASTVANAQNNLASVAVAVYTSAGKLDSLFNHSGLQILAAPPAGTTSALDTDFAHSPVGSSGIFPTSRLSNADLRIVSGYQLGSDTHIETLGLTAPGPDLAISETLNSPAVFSSGDKFDVTVQIKNIGTTLFNNKVEIDFGSGGLPYASTTAALHLAPGASKSIRIKFGVPNGFGVGPTLDASINTLGLFDELNSSNDNVSVPFKQAPSPE